MGNRLSVKLDRCLEKIDRSEPFEACLAEVNDGDRQVRQLLEVASLLKAMPRVEPSPQFRETAQGRLMARLGQEAGRFKVAEVGQRVPVIDDLADAGERLRRSLTRFFRVAVPVSLTLLVAVVLAVTASNLRHVPAALASECTLSILGGGVEVERPGDESIAGTDGMTLAVGARIKTSADTHAILTFFDGSTITLEPGADIEIQEMDAQKDHGMNIVMKQWAGRTWSRVVKMADAGWHYEIETPTATAIVRGTLFTTEVDKNGETTVATTEGLVSVAANGREIFIPPRQQTFVEPGGTPVPPSYSPEPYSQIMIHIDDGAVGSLIDPNGASTGHLPGGTSFNQIAGSRYLSAEDGTQDITVPGPEAGEYALVLRSVDVGPASFSITGTLAGQVIFSYADECGGSGEDGYIVRFHIQAADGKITGGQAGGIEPLRGGNPEKIVMPGQGQANNAQGPAANQGEHGQAVAGGTPNGGEGHGQPGNNVPETVNANNANNDQDHGKSAAPGQNGIGPASDNQGGPDNAPGQLKKDPEPTGGQSGQSTNAPGQSGNAPGQSGDAPGQSGDAPGQSGDAPGQSGSAPGQSGGAPGQSGDAPGQSGDAPGQSGSPPGGGTGNNGGENNHAGGNGHGGGSSGGLLGGLGGLLGGLLGN